MTTAITKNVSQNSFGLENLQLSLEAGQAIIETTLNVSYDSFNHREIELQSNISPAKTPKSLQKSATELESRTIAPEISISSNFNSIIVPNELSNKNISIEPQFVAGSELIKLNKLPANNSIGVDLNKPTVVIVDSGIDLNHSLFGPDNNLDGIADRIVYSYDFSGNNDADASAAVGDNHGSHVSSIVARTAPDTNLIHLKVFPDNPTSASLSDIEEALRWVVNNATAYNIVSVNMSLGPSDNVRVEAAEPVVGDELQALVTKGIIPTIAAGNAYGDFNQQGVSSFAADPNAIGVGAVYQKNEGKKTWGSKVTDHTTTAGQITGFSQRHTELTDIFAPGAMISGANATGGTIDLAGTSQAAPYIAGIAALAQASASRELGRKLSFREFRELIRVTGTTIIDGDNENTTVVKTGASYKLVDAQNMNFGILTGKTGVFPTAGVDTLNGTANNDVIAGFGGNDILTGGAGADNFVFNSVSDGGIDSISDFNASQTDKIVISSSFGATSATQFSYDLATGGLSFNGQQFATLMNASTPDSFVVSRDLVLS